jgi:hypothetical protein
MALWYLKPSQELAIAVNNIIAPVYSPGENYIPIDGSMFTTVDGSVLMNAPNDPNFTTEEQAIIQTMLDGKQTPAAAGSPPLMWYTPANDG